MIRTYMERLLPLAVVAGAALALSGCVAYPADPAYGYAPGYAGAVIAPPVVVAPRPVYRPYWGWHYWGWRGRRW